MSYSAEKRWSVPQPVVGLPEFSLKERERGSVLYSLRRIPDAELIEREKADGGQHSVEIKMIANPLDAVHFAPGAGKLEHLPILHIPKIREKIGGEQKRQKPAPEFVAIWIPIENGEYNEYVVFDPEDNVVYHDGSEITYDLEQMGNVQRATRLNVQEMADAFDQLFPQKSKFK